MIVNRIQQRLNINLLLAYQIFISTRLNERIWFVYAPTKRKKTPSATLQFSARASGRS